MDKNLNKWREEGKYLPEFLRDFHDQKDFFKFLHETLNVDENELTKNINWMQGHVYLIDCVLWKLARYGYTIQKSRVKQNFEDIEEAITKQTNLRNDSFTKSLLGDSIKNK
jgi:hypothetical protein